MPRSENQKLKLLYIADYLSKNTDEDHDVYVKDIRRYLNEEKGIECEEHSISRDIALLRDSFGMDIVGGKGRPYYLASRSFDYIELLIIAECIASAKYLSKSKADALICKLKQFCSVYQEQGLEGDVLNLGRVRTKVETVIYNLATIRSAMEGSFKSQKINFKYESHKIADIRNGVERMKGSTYTVSPFQIIINDGFVYLLAYSDRNKEIRSYRVDRMKRVKRLDEPVEGIEEFQSYDMKTYAKQSFGMFGGKRQEAKLVSIRFTNNLLDSVLDRFGTDGEVSYAKDDDWHFILRTKIMVSSQFFGWLCGFGNMAVIQSPPEVVQAFKEHLSKINAKYEESP